MPKYWPNTLNYPAGYRIPFIATEGQYDIVAARQKSDFLQGISKTATP